MTNLRYNKKLQGIVFSCSNTTYGMVSEMNLIGSWDLESKGFLFQLGKLCNFPPRPVSRQTSNGDAWPVEFKQAGETAETPRKRPGSQARKRTANQCPKVCKKGRSDGRGKGASGYRRERELTRCPFLTF